MSLALHLACYETFYYSFSTVHVMGYLRERHVLGQDSIPELSLQLAQAVRFNETHVKDSNLWGGRAASFAQVFESVSYQNWNGKGRETCVGPADQTSTT